MSNHAVLDNATHRDLRIRTEALAELGDGVMACFTMPAEFREVQGHFPILFRRDAETGRFSALALFGFENGENLFLADGEWDARYRPLALAIQPFLVGRPADGDGPAQVHIDLDHPRIATDGEGMRVFDEHGEPTPYVERVAEQLGILHDGFVASADFFAALQRYDLLEPFSLNVTLNDGSKHSLVGYHIINEEQLAALDGAALADLQQGGHLLPIHMAVASLTQIGELAARKNRSIAVG